MKKKTDESFQILVPPFWAPINTDTMRSERSERWIKYYSSSHNILLVGEGDFSFSLCLGLTFGSATNIVATTLDSYGISFHHFLFFFRLLSPVSLFNLLFIYSGLLFDPLFFIYLMVSWKYFSVLHVWYFTAMICEISQFEFGARRPFVWAIFATTVMQVLLLLTFFWGLDSLAHYFIIMFWFWRKRGIRR